MICTVSQILRSIKITNNDNLTRTLGELELFYDSKDRLFYRVGNSSVLFKVRRGDTWYSLKCYTYANPNLSKIYGDKLLKEELYIFGDHKGGFWIDVVLDKWIEGVTLNEFVERAACCNDIDLLSLLSSRFNQFAYSLLCEEWAHGDITYDNIIVDESYNLHLIDHDACFIPGMTPDMNCEVGTAAFQHPSRTIKDFDKHIDDYSLALISTALKALSIEPAIYQRLHYSDGLLLNPNNCVYSGSYDTPADQTLNYILDLLSKHGHAVSYRIGSMLKSFSMQLPDLHRYFEFESLGVNSDEVPCNAFYEHGLWGYCGESQKDIIPPLYNAAFDFSCSFAAVQLGQYWHYIDTQGNIAINCSEYEAIRPIRNDLARAKLNNEWITIDHIIL